MHPRDTASSLCLACGLCCNGVLFKDVELQPGDNPTALEAHGLKLEYLKSKARFPQPCAALCADNRCRIYSQRPARCGEFECGVFKSVAAGSLQVDAALRVIRQALRRANRVRTLLRQLGDADEHIPLSVRFRRTQRRMEKASLDDTTAEVFADLTLSVQDLNVLLHGSFYSSGVR